MLAPGMTINSNNRVVHNSALDNVSDYVFGGFGFKNNGALCFDTNGTPVGNFWVNGIRVNSTGCIYRKTLGAGDVWNSGLRMSQNGRLCVEQNNGSSFVNGNPLTPNGVLAIV
jgi:hypothetical protein